MTPAISLHQSLRFSMAPWIELSKNTRIRATGCLLFTGLCGQTHIEESALHLTEQCFSSTWTHTCWASIIFLICIYFWLCWAFVASRRHSLAVARGGYSLVCRLLTAMASLTEEHRLQAQQLWCTGLAAPRYVGSFALAGGFLNAGPAGKSSWASIIMSHSVLGLWWAEQTTPLLSWYIAWQGRHTVLIVTQIKLYIK